MILVQRRLNIQLYKLSYIMFYNKIAFIKYNIVEYLYICGEVLKKYVRPGVRGGSEIPMNNRY